MPTQGIDASSIFPPKHPNLPNPPESTIQMQKLEHKS